MKKGLTIALTMALLTATLGISISKHYCGNILRETALFVSTNGCGDMEMPKDCCEDEHEVHQLDVDFQLSVFDFEANPQLFLVYTLISDGLLEVTPQSTTPWITLDNGPPPGYPDIYIQVQSFLL